MTMKETELKPCPFCGGTDIEIYSYDPYDGYQGNLTRWCAVCTSCGCEYDKEEKSAVIEAWNRRADNEQREAD